ncbi:hypothetical protein E2C01_018166 [Portunus trituberculatus]|uniref:DUF7041 domain-containing protein n=1 Tax=Portunus trituberculatus TaxID=210409 RepID=A0A5B7DVF4_PORTR|nr:hypothetical protein [Portunus trituberculatus]
MYTATTHVTAFVATHLLLRHDYTSAVLSVLTAHVTFRGPPFCSQDPSMSFSIVECNFKAAFITANVTKFTHATALLPHDLIKVSDVISSDATSTTPYDVLKAAFLN